jgi:hypothetical protein
MRINSVRAFKMLRYVELPVRQSRLSVIATFTRVVKRKNRIYRHDKMNDILDYLTMTVLEPGAIAKIACDTGIPECTLRDWNPHRHVDKDWFPSFIVIVRRQRSIQKVKLPLQTVCKQITGCPTM